MRNRRQSKIDEGAGKLRWQRVMSETSLCRIGLARNEIGLEHSLLIGRLPGYVVLANCMVPYYVIVWRKVGFFYLRNSVDFCL